MRHSLSACVALVALAVLAASGCRSPYYADKGALLGGLAGAGIGAIVGENNDNALAGAAIGGAVGALSGAVIGDGIDQDIARDQAIIEAKLGRRLAGAATKQDVIAMTQAGVAEPVILNYVRSKGVAQPLTAADVIALHQQGVTPAVIDAMQTSALPREPIAVPAPRPVIVEEYHYVRPYPHCWHHHSCSPRVGFHYHGHF